MFLQGDDIQLGIERKDGGDIIQIEGTMQVQKELREYHTIRRNYAGKEIKDINYAGKERGCWDIIQI